MPCIDTSVTAVISHQETLQSHQHLTQIPKTCPNNTSPDSMLCSSAVHSIFAKSYCNLKLNQANSLFIFICLASSTLQAPRPLRVSHHLDRQVTSYDQSWTIEPRGLWKKRKTNKQTKKQYMSAGLWWCGCWENLEFTHRESIPPADSLSWGPVLPLCVLSWDICHCCELLM